MDYLLCIATCQLSMNTPKMNIYFWLSIKPSACSYMYSYLTFWPLSNNMHVAHCTVIRSHQAWI